VRYEARRPERPPPLLPRTTRAQARGSRLPGSRRPALANKASEAPRCLACASATTLSAYDVDLTPAVAARSLRVHGTTVSSDVGAAGFCGPLVTSKVNPSDPRSLLAGPGPAVSVIRTRPRAHAVPASTADTAVASRSWSGVGKPTAAAERERRRKWRVRPKGTPWWLFSVSNTPSPTVSPWSKTLTTASDSSSTRPFSQIAMAGPYCP
jgi:hypothetical protein